jgi:hypothetical protein
MEHCSKKPGDEKEIPAFGPDSVEMAMRHAVAHPFDREPAWWVCCQHDRE